MKIKVLTVKQPWASLIVHGIKDIENRTWNTNFRGRILIHASSNKKEGWCLNDIQRFCLKQSGSVLYNTALETLPFGAIIGSIEVIDCVQNHPSIWAEKGVYHWVLANPVLFEKPIENVKGKLGLWSYDWEETICL